METSKRYLPSDCNHLCSANSNAYENPLRSKISKFSVYLPIVKLFDFITNVKAEPHIPQFSENRRTSNERSSVFVHSRYSSLCAEYFSAHLNFWKKWILANTVCENQFSRLLVNLCKNARECWRIISICLFSPTLRELVFVRFHLNMNRQTSIHSVKYFWLDMLTKV